ncbi:hypothetical protein KIN20_030548 [Parelaphostrongylus tenuis]|uniref:HSF-type DNA-binding domain-containing protein n=1 Tax=Parelaphostrongylus tenuis TaxID=148309 RepID=A0AAD5R4C2_PARTN|nr:hypothetical protein KIN20_030548 [Parelaphostrongylus tenuis]
MASGVGRAQEAASSAEHLAGPSYRASWGVCVSGEALEKQGDQPESPDPGLHDNLPPQGPKPEMANKEENNAVLGLSFPRKLWRIVEDAAFTSVRWNDEGDMVVIEADLFQTEVLQRRGADQIFETDKHQELHP